MYKRGVSLEAAASLLPKSWAKLFSPALAVVHRLAGFVPGAISAINSSSSSNDIVICYLFLL